MKTTCVLFAGAILAGLCLSHSPSATAQQPKTKPVKGDNVMLVIYLKGKEVGGAISQGPGKTWYEDNDDGRFEFTECARDEWSVYMLKKDGALIQLDLFTKKMYIVGGPLTPAEIRDPNLALGRKKELYTIHKAYR